MNEQIKKLIEQAGFEEQDGHISIQGVYMFNTTRMEKFAELIVQECVNVINKNMPEFTCKEDYENLIRRAGRMDAIDEIEQHFGVE